MTAPGISILDGKYMITVDLYPQQNEQFNQIYPFFHHLREGRFTTKKCKDCGPEPFPPRIMCPECTLCNVSENGNRNGEDLVENWKRRD